jgi:hypothetical protein
MVPWTVKERRDLSDQVYSVFFHFIDDQTVPRERE